MALCSPALFFSVIIQNVICRVRPSLYPLIEVLTLPAFRQAVLVMLSEFPQFKGMIAIIEKVGLVS